MVDKYDMINETTERETELLKTMTDIQIYPDIVEEANLLKYEKLSLSRLPALGVALEPLAVAFHNVVNGGEAKSGLYRVTVPKGGKLAKFKDGSGCLGSVLKPNGAVGGGQAVLNPLVCDPTVLIMAVVLANFDKKLDSIQEVQREILGFLVQKEKSELRGDLNFLIDIFNNYKYSWNNDKYKSSNHIKVLDIRQVAEQKIDFFRERIMSKINKKSFFHREQEVRKQLDKIESEFKDYQLALYLYSFSSFLEVILLENFDSAYLDGISNKIEDYSLKYRELYTNSYNTIESYAKSSIQSRILKGLENINKVAGETIGKVPVISKLQIDETLIEIGEKMGDFGTKRTEQTMEQFVKKQSSYVRPFIESINTVNRLYNQPIELIFERENIYFSIVE